MLAKCGYVCGRTQQLNPVRHRLELEDGDARGHRVWGHGEQCRLDEGLAFERESASPWTMTPDLLSFFWATRGVAMPCGVSPHPSPLSNATQQRHSTSKMMSDLLSCFDANPQVLPNSMVLSLDPYSLQMVHHCHSL